MKYKIALVWLCFAVSGSVFGQTIPINVQKTAGTNAITADLVIPSGRALSATGTGTIGATSVTYAASVTETAGTGSPEGVVTANIGSVYHRTNGSTGTTLYIKESGTGNTGWVAVSSGGSGDMLLGTAQTVTAAKTYNAGTLKIASGGDLVDANGNEIFKFTATASAVNEFTIANAATGNGPTLSATGGDTNIPINITAKGTGGILLNSNVGLGATPSTYQFHIKQSGQNQAAIETTGAASFAALRFITTSRTFQFAAGSAAGSFYCYDETAGVYRFYVSSTGNFLVGSTSETGLTGAGGFRVGSTTASTSSTTGAALIDGGLGVAGAAYIGGNFVPSQTNGIVGTTTNNDANAGSFGQYVSSAVAVGSAVSLTTNTAANITSISLTAGDWEVSGNANFTAASATVTGTSGGITSTSATVPTDGTEVYSGVQVTLLSETDSVTLPSKRFSLSGTTTVYLVGKSTFSAGTVGGFGSIKARRVR
jgi:hypothetical protein